MKTPQGGATFRENETNLSGSAQQSAGNGYPQAPYFEKNKVEAKEQARNTVGNAPGYPAT